MIKKCITLNLYKSRKYSSEFIFKIAINRTKVVKALRQRIFNNYKNRSKATHHYLFLFINHDASSSKIAKRYDNKKCDLNERLYQIH